MDRALRTAYFAGIIDGEGSIGFHSQGKGLRLRAVVKVSMTCHKTILALREHFGGSLCTKKVPAGNRPQWCWGVTSRKAHIVACAVRPYLITKAAQADVVIDFYERRDSKQ